MRDRLLTIIPVTLIAVLIWLFAEAESLGTFSDEIAPIRFTSGEGADRIIRFPDGFRNSVALDFRAPQASIGRIRSTLAAGITLRPGMPGIPSSAGIHEVDLERALQRTQALSGQGIDLLSVRPQTIQIEIIDFETREILVEPRLEGVDVEDTVTVSPPSISVRLPRSTWDQVDSNVRLLAIPTAAGLARLPTSGPARLEVGVTLPPELASLPDVTRPSQRVTLSFTLRNRNRTAQFGIVPVWVLLPPFEMGSWRVSLHPEDEIIRVTAEGPADEIEKMESPDHAIVGVLTLSSEELETGIQSKRMSILQRNGETVSKIPETVTVTPNKSTVRFTIERTEP